MILKQSINDYNEQPAQVTCRKTYAVGGTLIREGQFILLPNKTYTTSINPYSWLMLAFDRDGRYIQLIGSTGKYLPACVIG